MYSFFFSEVNRETVNVSNPVSICLFKISNGNIRAICEICSKFQIKTPERRQWRCSGIFIVYFEQIAHIVLVFPLLILDK